MLRPAELIRRLHGLLRQRAEVRSQLERGPKRIKAAKANVELAQKALSDHREALKKKRMEVDRDQLLMKSREAKIFDAEGKMNMAKKNIEYQTLKDQIAADAKANEVLSDEILAKAEEIDRLLALTPGLEEKLKALETESQRIEATTNERKVTLDADLIRVNEELTATEACLTGDLKASYQRLVETRDEDAIAPLEGRSCGGCNTSLPPKVLDKLKMREPMVCTSCACLIIPPEVS
jgi:uncharacterized protein